MVGRDIVTTSKDGVTHFAGTGTAGDKTLAVSGTLGGDKVEIEVRVGVGGGAKVSHLVLKKTAQGE